MSAGLGGGHGAIASFGPALPLNFGLERLPVLPLAAKAVIIWLLA